MSVWRIAFFIVLLCGVQVVYKRERKKNVSKKCVKKKVEKNKEENKPQHKTLKKKQATKIPILLL